MRNLLHALVDETFQTRLLVPFEVPPKGPLTHPKQAHRFLSAAPIQPPYASVNLIFRASCSQFVRFI